MLVDTFARLTKSAVMVLSVTALLSCATALGEEDDIVADKSLVSSLKKHGVQLHYHYDKETTVVTINRRPETPQEYDILKRISTLRHLFFDYAAEDRDLKNASKCTQINSLGVPEGRITPEGLRHLTKLRKLKVLFLMYSNLTDAGLKEFQNITTLETLDVERTKITGKGLIYLKNMQGLKSLHLIKTAVDDAGLEHVSGLTSLECLFLDETAVSDAGLTHLRKLVNLQRLTLNRSNVSDEGLSELRHLPSLQTLSLSGTKITDAGVKDLLAIKNERGFRLSIDLTDTQVTSKGIDALRKARPLWIIECDEGTIGGVSTEEPPATLK